MKKLLLLLSFTLLSVSAFADMPYDVLAIVKADLEKRYPNNYSMQKILLDKQNEDYDFLQSYSPSGVSVEVFDGIKSSIQKRYPYNFSLQRMLIEKQVEDYLELNQ